MYFYLPELVLSFMEGSSIFYEVKLGKQICGECSILFSRLDEIIMDVLEVIKLLAKKRELLIYSKLEKG